LIFRSVRKSADFLCFCRQAILTATTATATTTTAAFDRAIAALHSLLAPLPGAFAFFELLFPLLEK
jgi:hypothetical protein